MVPDRSATFHARRSTACWTPRSLVRKINTTQACEARGIEVDADMFRAYEIVAVRFLTEELLGWWCCYFCDVVLEKVLEERFYCWPAFIYWIRLVTVAERQFSFIPNHD